LFALLSALIWGSAPVLFKLGLKGELSPLAGVFVHNAAAALFSAFLLFLYKENPFSYSVRELLAVALGGVLSGVAGLLAYYKAVKEGEVSVVAPLASTSPLFSFFLSVVLLGESFSGLKLLGTVLIVLGAVLLSVGRQ